MPKKEHDLTKLRADQVLALDIATHCGYFHPKESGTWNFSESAKNSWKQHKSFRDTLCSFIEAHDIKLICAEDLVYQAGRFNATKKLGEFRGILFEVCDEYDLPDPIFVPPTTIKINACNNGKASKEQVMDGVRKKWGLRDGADDNEADAISCYYYVKNKYRLQ